MSNLNYIFSFSHLKSNLRLNTKHPLAELIFFFKWYFSKQRLQSIERLKKYKNKHLNQRCFIIGNGPSLNKMNLRPLSEEYTFGLNRIYLLFQKLGFNTTYYVSVNQLVIEQFKDQISHLEMPKFISCRAIDYLPFDSNTIFMKTFGGKPSFSYDPSEKIWESGTVTYVAMQIANYMGFKEIILIGVDHNFKSVGYPNSTVVSKQDDPNHFDPNYFGKGIKWQLPDLHSSELGYKLANKTLTQNGKLILDATVDGKLNIFEKIDYDSLFE